MLESFAIGVGGIISMMVLWVVVQSLWRKTFSDYISDDDVLADRRSCGNCGCATACEKKRNQLSAD